MRTKLEFCALRHELGLTLDELASRLSVTIRTVSRWEDTRDEEHYKPTQAAWALIDELKRLQELSCAEAINRVHKIERELGKKPTSVQISYFTSQADYEEHHRPKDGGTWRTANANARLTAQVLRAQGYSVEYVYAVDGARCKFLHE